MWWHKMNYDERLADRVVKAAMPDVDLIFNTDQSNSVADFFIKKDGEEIGVLEVTRCTNQKGEELRSLIQKNLFIKRKLCKSDWLIHLGEDARINRIRQYADQYLRNIERSRINDFFSPIHADIEPVRRIWEDLCIEGGKITKWKRPCIGIMGPVSGGIVKSETVWKSVRPEVHKPDNLRKLGRSVDLNRHLFVVIDDLQGPAYVSIRHSEPPQDIPSLPQEITHIWVAAEEGEIVYVWLADSFSWRKFTTKINQIA